MSHPHPLLYRVVAGYQLNQYVGAGGMGEVFKAIHPPTGRLAAVKVLYRPEFAARFRNEAVIQSSVSHPNIAGLYDYAMLDKRPALVMEWVEGVSLDELIRQRNRLDNEEATRIVSQIADALVYLHQHGIVHRDLKPSNVRVRPDGLVKLLDFGIAKGQHTPQLTQAGYVVGTTEFMAPEQFRSQVSSASDVWALGVLLYELTTGHLPFESANPLELRRQIERGQYTSPRLLNPALSSSLLGLINACLETNPAKRPTAADIGHRLQSVAAGRLPSGSAFSMPSWATVQWAAPLNQWLLAALVGLVGIVLISQLNGASSGQSQPDSLSEVRPRAIYEKIRVDVLNVDDDLELVMPDGSVQASEPFVVQRIPGQPLPITIRHGGTQQQFVIDPDVRGLYQCYFDQ